MINFLKSVVNYVSWWLGTLLAIVLYISFNIIFIIVWTFVGSIINILLFPTKFNFPMPALAYSLYPSWFRNITDFIQNDVAGYKIFKEEEK